MRPVGGVNEVFDAMQRVKAEASAFITNFFPAPKKLQGWIEHTELFAAFHEGAAFFFRQDRGFWHFYYCAADLAALQRGMGTLPELKSEKMVADLIGNEASLAGVLGALEGAGFRRYSHLQRMARGGQPHEFPASAAATNLACAESPDSAALLALIESAFDRYADQLPMPYEMEAAVQSRQVLVAKDGGEVGALLFFETQGVTSTVRYWVVAERFRERRFGSALMRRYFEDHKQVKRFVLWVVAGNRNAVEKYEHYGYKADGLIDHVLVNEMIRP